MNQVKIKLQKFNLLNRIKSANELDVFMSDYISKFEVILTRLAEIHKANMEMLLNPINFKERKSIEKAFKYRDLIFGLSSDNDILIKNVTTLRVKILEINTVRDNPGVLNLMSAQKLLQVQKLMVGANTTAPEITVINRIIGKLNSLVEVFNTQGMFSYVEYSQRRQHQVDYEYSSVVRRDAQTFKRRAVPELYQTKAAEVLRMYIELIEQQQTNN